MFLWLLLLPGSHPGSSSLAKCDPRQFDEGSHAGGNESRLLIVISKLVITLYLHTVYVYEDSLTMPARTAFSLCTPSVHVHVHTCSTMNCACLSKTSSVNLVQPMDWGGTVVWREEGLSGTDHVMSSRDYLTSILLRRSSYDPSGFCSQNSITTYHHMSVT